MGIVNRRYVSEHTLWMRDMQAAHPEWVEAQASGRALWWDKLQDPQPGALREAARGCPDEVSFGARRVDR
jgi:hypothetical protein